MATSRARGRGTRRPARGLLRAFVATVVVVASASCSTVRSGVNIFSARGEDAGDPLSQPYVRIIAEPPKPQATPFEVVNGFLAASASFDDPLRSVARQYLTGDAQRGWSPFDAVTIYDGKLDPDTPKDDVQQAHVALKGTVLGTLDSDGHYVPSEASAASELNKGFTLVKANGQWRISSAPAGLLLSNDDFKRAYRSFDLYFPGYHSEGLVVDQVRVPINPSEGLAKSLVRQLLDGPTTPLRGAVDSAFGPNVSVNNVSVDGDTVVVDFSYGIVGSALSDREALSAQLAWTLKPLTESRRIEVRVNGEQFPGGPFIIDPRRFERFDPDVLKSDQARAYYLEQGKLRLIDKESGHPVILGAQPGQTRQFTGLAVSNGQPFRVAALEKGGGVWVTGTGSGSQWQRWMEGADLTPPSWDRYGDLWSVARTGPHKSQVLRAHDASRQMPVSAPELEATDVDAFRVARDGARVAVISDAGHGQRVLIGSINRASWAVQNLHILVAADDKQQITDIAWQDADTLLVLTKGDAGQQLTAWSVTQGIGTETPKASARITTVTAAPDPAPILAGTADGEIMTWDPRKGQWTTLLKGASTAPAYPLG